MHRYCTFFDHRYLDRGLAMLRSLRRADPGSQVVVLCLTASCERVLAGLCEPGVTTISLAAFEQANPDLLPVKAERAPRDYAFLLASCLVWWAMRSAPDDEVVTYLDADLFFYASPEPLFAAMAAASVGLVGHRHHWWTKRLEKYGRFNVGWVSFRCDEKGRAAALWWRTSCIDWCYGYVDPENDRFADQKYLDHMFAKFPGVIEIDHPGANLGPWNVCRHSLRATAEDGFTVDAGAPLIFFHFSGVREAAPGSFACSNISYLCPFSELVREGIYRPYLARLHALRTEIGGLPDEDSPNLAGSPPVHRARIAPLLRAVGRWMGHYIDI